MRTVVVYESVYGNTRRVAEELAAVARSQGEAVVVPVEIASRATLDGADLLLVGGPTHLHGMSFRATRQSGISDAVATHGHPAGSDVPGPGLRDWFGSIGQVDGLAAAAFDTRTEGPALVTGRASVGIGRRLRHHGFAEVAAPRSFLVTSDNHLVEGEIERAHDWATSVLDSLLMDTAPWRRSA